MNSKNLAQRIDKEGLTIFDRRANKKWEIKAPFFVVHYQLAAGEKTAASACLPENGWQVRVETGPDKSVVTYESDKTGLRFSVEFKLEGNYLEVSLPIKQIKEASSARLLSMEFMPAFGAAAKGEEGYLFLPNYSGVLSYFNKDEPCEHRNMTYCGSVEEKRYWCVSMPVFGIKYKDAAFLAVISSGEFDAEIVAKVAQGREKLHSVYACLHCRYYADEKMDAVDRTIRYYFLSGKDAGYVGMAKAYRNHVLCVKGIKPLKQRAKERKEMACAINALNLRILCAIREGRTGEGRICALTTFKEAQEIVGAYHDAGFDKVLVTLVGWQAGGHDAYPLSLSNMLEADLGTEDDLKDLIRYCNSLGYQLVFHDNYFIYDQLSDQWNTGKDIVKKHDGSLSSGGSWAAGPTFVVCAKEAYKFARRNFTRIKDWGIKGMYYIDVIASANLWRCYDKEHPLTRREFAGYHNKILQLAQDTFGAVQTEGPYDYAMGISDNSLHIFHKGLVGDGSGWLNAREFFDKVVDKVIPFVQIAYHGVFLYNHMQISVNGENHRRRFLEDVEYGAMPSTETTFREGSPACIIKGWPDYQKWMPVVQEYYRTLCQKMGHLAFEFIDDHKEISPGIFETIYTDGTKITVDYRKGRFKIFRKRQ